jgi:hypothetical protein
MPSFYAKENNVIYYFQFKKDRDTWIKDKPGARTRPNISELGSRRNRLKRNKYTGGISHVPRTRSS